MSKSLPRKLAISTGLILVAFLAKMEAINFLIALWVAILVLVKAYTPIFKAHEDLGEKIESKLHIHPLALIFRIMWEILSGRPLYYLWFLVSGLSGWLVYSILNLLFISQPS